MDLSIISAICKPGKSRVFGKMLLAKFLKLNRINAQVGEIEAKSRIFASFWAFFAGKSGVFPPDFWRINALRRCSCALHSFRASTTNRDCRETQSNPTKSPVWRLGSCLCVKLRDKTFIRSKAWPSFQTQRNRKLALTEVDGPIFPALSVCNQLRDSNRIVCSLFPVP